MADYGHDLLFGTFLTPTAENASHVLELAQLTDGLGLDLVTVQDHPYQARFLDTWTLLSVIAARTVNVRVSPNVANLPLRPPAVLARSVATLDILSGGRVELGLGAYKPRMLALTGRLADGWLPSHSYAGPEALGAMNRAVDDAALAAGREPAAVRRLYNIGGRFGPTGRGFLDGPPSVWAEQLAELTLTQGMSAYILGSDDPDDIRRFADDVVPLVRDLVAYERGALLVPAPAAVDEQAPPAGIFSAGLAVEPTPDDGPG